jgi:hypothetical protein
MKHQYWKKKKIIIKIIYLKLIVIFSFTNVYIGISCYQRFILATFHLKRNHQNICTLYHEEKRMGIIVFYNILIHIHSQI